MTAASPTQTEIIAVASGKGGTGKTIILASLGYALQYSGHRVLFIDTDTSTDGLSLFVLGPDGKDAIRDLAPANTFAGFLHQAMAQGASATSATPFSVNRGRKDDHGQIYEALVSGSNIYGDRPDEFGATPAQSVTRDSYREAVTSLFKQLRDSNRWDYVLVDTRGGFSFDTVDTCVLADYFFLVTEPNPSSFYQDKSLIGRIVEAGQAQTTRKPSLRGVFVNKATEITTPDSATSTNEYSPVPAIHKQDLKDVEPVFRNLIVSEFGLRYADTYPIPLDIDAVDAYKSQRVPYLAYPGSVFSYSTLAAFSQLMRTVTVQWPSGVQRKWNAFVDEISAAINAKNENVRKAAERQQAILDEREKLKRDNETLSLQLDELKKTYNQAAEGEKLRLQRDRELFDIQAAQNRTRQIFQLTAAVSVVVALFMLGALYVFDLNRTTGEVQLDLTRTKQQLVQLQSKAQDAERTTAAIRNWLWPAAKFFTDDGRALDGNGQSIKANPQRALMLEEWAKGNSVVFNDDLISDPDNSTIRARAIRDLHIPTNASSSSSSF